MTYFQPWDWVIGVGAYEDDFMDSLARIDIRMKNLVIWAGIGVLICVIGGCVLAIWLVPG